MGKQIFMNYWIAEQPSPPTHTLDRMPAFVDIVPLALLNITNAGVDGYKLNFDFILKHGFSLDQLKTQVNTVRARGTKVLFSINDPQVGSIPEAAQAKFVANVVQTVNEWGVDGLDLDYEPPQPSNTLVPLVKALRNALKPGSLITAPIYAKWLEPGFNIHDFAAGLDYVSTMDYTPYWNFDQTISNCERYVAAMGKGGWEKLLIGVSCMGPVDSDNFTPLTDVVRFSQLPLKAGIMNYTYTYDVKTRNAGTTGTGQPDGSWTETIGKNLPKQ